MTGTSISSRKQKLRKKIISILNVQKKEERFKRSQAIQKKLFALKEFKQAKTIMFFASFDGEVETFRMIKQAMKLGKQIALPVTVKKEKQIIPSKITDLEKELNIGPYGIKQPKGKNAKFVSPEDIDLVVVPGVAFDYKGNRLGRGAGYYDRFLRTLPSNTTKIGLAFSFQILKVLPHRRHQDTPVDRVVFA